LQAFRKNCGRYIDGLTKEEISYGNESKRNEYEESFRSLVVEEIEKLTGQKPRIAITNERHCIYYS
jgi:hypothetical protein